MSAICRFLIKLGRCIGNSFSRLHFCVFTIGRSALQPKMQPDHFSLINIERFATALADHDSLSALR